MFDTELHDLATACVTQRGQVAYAVNLTVRTWSLRQALTPSGMEAHPMTRAGLGAGISVAGVGGVLLAGIFQNPVALVVTGVAVLAPLAAVIVVVLTSALSCDPYRQPNATATLDRLIHATLSWRRSDPGLPPPSPPRPR